MSNEWGTVLKKIAPMAKDETILLAILKKVWNKYAHFMSL